jgi:glutaredoxin
MFEITSTKTCVYCTQAKKRLDDLGLPYREKILETPAEKLAFSEDGFTTVPQIWKDGSHIGGYNQLVDWLRENITP